MSNPIIGSIDSPIDRSIDRCALNSVCVGLRAGSTFDNSYSRLYKILTAETAAKLNKFGFCVVDNALGSTEAYALRQEIIWYERLCDQIRPDLNRLLRVGCDCRLYENQIMGSNNTAYVERSGDGKTAGISQLISKPNVYEVRTDIIVPTTWDLIARCCLIG